MDRRERVFSAPYMLRRNIEQPRNTARTYKDESDEPRQRVNRQALEDRVCLRDTYKHQRKTQNVACEKQFGYTLNHWNVHPET